MIYSQNALDPLLEDKSVNLFITHPPYYDINVSAYGDTNNQLHKKESHQSFIDGLIRLLNVMIAALTDNGHIFIIYPNHYGVFEFMHEALKSQKIKFTRSLIWNFSTTVSDRSESWNDFSHILHFYNGDIGPDITRNLEYPMEHDIVKRYEYFGHPYDSMPVDLPKYLITNFTKENDVVADLLAGTGSVALAAKELNRKYIYNDLSDNQTLIAKLRLGEITMDRPTVIDMMSTTVENFNRGLALQSDMPLDQIDQMIKQQKPILDQINGMIYDMLLEHKVINP